MCDHQCRSVHCLMEAFFADIHKQLPPPVRTGQGSYTQDWPPQPQSQPTPFPITMHLVGAGTRCIKANGIPLIHYSNHYEADRCLLAIQLALSMYKRHLANQPK
jgi:hypothetical protein